MSRSRSKETGVRAGSTPMSRSRSKDTGAMFKRDASPGTPNGDSATKAQIGGQVAILAREGSKHTLETAESDTSLTVLVEQAAQQQHLPGVPDENTVEDVGNLT